MTAQRGIATPIILAIVGIVILAVGGFFFLQKSPSSTLKQQAPSQSQKDSSFSFEVTDKKLILSGGFADPSVISFKDQLIMYVNKFGNGGSSNLIYNSQDGISWQPTSNKVPGGPTARAFIDGEIIRLYYPTQVPINPSDPPSQMLSAKSSDAVAFTNDEGIRLKPTVGYIIEGPSIIKIDDQYQMYFSEFEEKSPQNRMDGKIFGATSKDGLTWVRDEKALIKSDTKIEKAPADWPQAIRPYVLKRPAGGYVMFYNSHSKIFVAYSEDGKSWEKLGGLGLKGADVDGFYQEDGTIRIYFGDFSEATSGVVYTAILKEVKGKAKTEETSPMNEPVEGVRPLGGSKPPPPPACVGKDESDPNLPQECQMWFKIQ